MRAACLGLDCVVDSLKIVADSVLQKSLNALGAQERRFPADVDIAAFSKDYLNLGGASKEVTQYFDALKDKERLADSDRTDIPLMDEDL